MHDSKSNPIRRDRVLIVLALVHLACLQLLISAYASSVFFHAMRRQPSAIPVSWSIAPTSPLKAKGRED
jgi:hypothetical protein